MLTVVPLVLALVAQSREELLAQTKYASHPAAPKFATFDPPALRNAIKVVSDRNGAAFGFNDPAIVVYVPAVDNSVYAVFDFSTPKVHDAGNRDVKYELERGLYDHDRHENQIRLRPGPDKKTVAFARVSGTVTLRYPARIRTLTIKGRGSNDVGIDGPYVSYPATLPIPELSMMQPFESIRAYDASGKQLERAPSCSSGASNGPQSQTCAFWGKIASVQVDVVDAWQDVSIAYDLPPVPPLPASQQGLTRAAPAAIADTPGGKVTITLAPKTEAAAGGGRDAAVASGGSDGPPMSRTAALAALQRAGFPEATASNFVMSTLKHDWSVVRLFLAAGVPIDALYERDHVTALHRAADSGNVDVALHLLAAGANPNVKDDIGASVLLGAAGHCDATALVKALLAKGADVNAASRGGATPLAIARLRHCAENAAALAKAGGR
jgi:hypothetical protein